MQRLTIMFYLHNSAANNMFSIVGISATGEEISVPEHRALRFESIKEAFHHVVVNEKENAERLGIVDWQVVLTSE